MPSNSMCTLLNKIDGAMMPYEEVLLKMRVFKICNLCSSKLSKTH